MKLMSLCILLGISIPLSQCDFLPLAQTTEISAAGFIVTEHEKDRRFYLQDIQDGSVVELKFFFDQNDEIHFEEFNYVEVKGLFTKNENVIYVEELHPSYKECNASYAQLTESN